MNEIFIKYFEESLKLKKRFKITEKKDWQSLDIMNELSVQVGHVLTVVNNSTLLENGRKIDDLGDEVSDIIFQLILLSHSLGISVEFFKKLNMTENDIDSFLIVFGQCNECLLETNGLRFSKPRLGFENSEDFIAFKINQMFEIIFNFCDLRKINIDVEYNKMLIDANNFLDRYAK